MSDKWKSYDDRLAYGTNPKQMGTIAISMALLSLLIIPQALATFATLGGVVGAYAAVKQKSGWRLVLLNVFAIILGLTCGFLSIAAVKLMS